VWRVRDGIGGGGRMAEPGRQFLIESGVVGVRRWRSGCVGVIGKISGLMIQQGARCVVSGDW